MKKRLKNDDHEKTDDYFGGDDGDSRLRPSDEFLQGTQPCAVPDRQDGL